MKNNPIGILDSGIGGISILKEITNLMPNENIVYFADSKRSPYGSKSEQEIKNISLSITSFLIQKYNIKTLVLACNTATVSAVKYLRTKLPKLPIVGLVPVIKPASINSKAKEIACLATNRTIKSETQQNLIINFAFSNNVKVHNIACEGLVELIEKGLSNSSKLTLKLQEYINPLKHSNIDTVVLGCTHYTLIEKQIKNLLKPNVSLMNSNKAIAKQVKNILNNKIQPYNIKPYCHFIVNGNIEHFANIIKPFLGSNFSLSQYNYKENYKTIQ